MIIIIIFDRNGYIILKRWYNHKNNAQFTKRPYGSGKAGQPSLAILKHTHMEVEKKVHTNIVNY